VDNIKQMLDFADRQGFSFIEIRDPDASLTLRECEELAIYASQKDVEVIYAMASGLLNPDYWEIFSRAIANASIFNGPKVVRTGVCGVEFLNDKKKQYWTSVEFAMIVKNANKAASIAKISGLQFLIENGWEGLQGDGVTTFGTRELFSSNGVNENVGLQLDVANFFCSSRVPSKPDDVKMFVANSSSKIGYTHLKTSKDHKPQQVLDGNELSFEIFFDLLQKQDKNYIVIELSQSTVLADVYENHIQSVDYLKKNY
jgi:sugar phosphate isomerase/epimerase